MRSSVSAAKLDLEQRESFKHATMTQKVNWPIFLRFGHTHQNAKEFGADFKSSVRFCYFQCKNISLLHQSSLQSNRNETCLILSHVVVNQVGCNLLTYYLGELASIVGGCNSSNWETGISGCRKGQTALSWVIVTPNTVGAAKEQLGVVSSQQTSFPQKVGITSDNPPWRQRFKARGREG